MPPNVAKSTAVVEEKSTAPGDGRRASQVWTRADVAEHDRYDDAWVIVEDGVYDVTTWGYRHPGGRVIFYYRGQDATEAVLAQHPDMEKTRRYMKPLCVGHLSPAEADRVPPVIKDFRKLRDDLEAEGLYDPKASFYLAHLASIIAMEVLAVVVLCYTGSLFLTACILATSQIQAGWLQHDFGHAAVFDSAFWNQMAHFFIIGHLKGAMSWWWKSRHNRHHSKTNVIKMDPDFHTEPFFAFSEDLVTDPRFKASKRYIKNWIPYQHLLWFLFGPPAVTTILFLVENVEWLATRASYADTFAVVSFYVRFDLVYGYFLPDFWSRIALFTLMRVLESHWFTWVTSMSHLPLPKTVDLQEDWVHLQLGSSQNVTTGPFHDWFSGHLNYQIEHHLFPNMPRHSYEAVRPRVQELCKKHDVPYIQTSMWGSFVGVVQKLKSVATVYENSKAEHIAAKQKN